EQNNSRQLSEEKPVTEDSESVHSAINNNDNSASGMMDYWLDEADSGNR
nr:hypothetical protein [Tanacetum cinerariifolium]